MLYNSPARLKLPLRRGVRYSATVDTPPSTAFSKQTAGLCSDCRNAQIIQSSRGSVFLLCKLSATDPSFPKYPRLPMPQCSGYSPAKPS